VIRHYSIDLFGHTAVEASQACFHMGNPDLQLCGCQGSGQSGIGVTVNDQQVWALLYQDWFQ
jgi:hypothetical protein